jgi:hypothetical protein
MKAFIDEHRDAYEVELICRVLPIAPSTYHAHAARRADPGKLPARARSDAALMVEIRRVFEANFHVYGVRKDWRRLGRDGIVVARCTVARLMRARGLKGVVRRQEGPDDDPRCGSSMPARPNRRFKASRPDALWSNSDGGETVRPGADRAGARRGHGAAQQRCGSRTRVVAGIDHGDTAAMRHGLAVEQGADDLCTLGEVRVALGFVQPGQAGDVFVEPLPSASHRRSGNISASVAANRASTAGWCREPGAVMMPEGGRVAAGAAPSHDQAWLE